MEKSQSCEHVSYKYPCTECGKIVIAKSLKKQFCGDCIRKHRINKVERWKNKNKRKVSEYYMYYNIFRRKGTGSLGSHRRNDLDLERKMVRNEKIRIFKNGSGWVSNKKDKILFWKKKLIGDKHYSFAFHELIFDSELVCPICESGIITKPDPIHSYDYNSDGFVMRFCTNCCNVVDILN